MTREQIIGKLIEDEKNYFDMTSSEEEMVRMEYERELEKLKIESSDKCEELELDEVDGGTAYNFGNGLLVGIDSRATMRYMYRI